MNIRYSISALALFAALALPQISAAYTVYGLTSRDQLIKFNSASPNTVTQATFITGLSANESLVGIDFRPANGMLYGLGSFGRIYTINTMTAQATFVSAIFDSITMAPISLSGSGFGVDFNPVPDRLRVTSNLGQNLRINVATGSTVVDGMLNMMGGTPHVVASAYTNSFAGATSTTLYNIDSAMDMLNRQVPPNAGTQVMVGMLGLDTSALAGMDIVTNGMMNDAFAVLQPVGTTGSMLSSLNLTTGQATLLGQVGLNQTSDVMAVRDIAIQAVPEPASMAVLGAGAALLLRRRRRA